MSLYCCGSVGSTDDISRPGWLHCMSCGTDVDAYALDWSHPINRFVTGRRVQAVAHGVTLFGTVTEVNYDEGWLSFRFDGSDEPLVVGNHPTAGAPLELLCPIDN